MFRGNHSTTSAILQMYDIGVITTNKVTAQDLPEVQEKKTDHKKIMKDKTKGQN